MKHIFSDITVLIITFNEEPNISRVIERLFWAPKILVIDSGSSDATIEILGKHESVEVISRHFDTFARQCNFGLKHINTRWVLSLDADYVLSNSLVEEILALREDPQIDGYFARFTYLVNGRPVLGSLYPPRIVLYRAADAQYDDEGHGHRVRVRGATARLKNKIYHDDRKPLSRWLGAQMRYAQQEAAMLMDISSGNTWADRFRRTCWIMPILVPIYIFLVKGGIFGGRAGWIYLLQRTFSEILIALELHEARRSSTDESKNRLVRKDGDDEGSPKSY